MDQPKGNKLSQLDPRRTYRLEELPKDLDLEKMKVVAAKQMKNGKAVKVNPQQIVIKQSGEKVQVDLVTDIPNPKKPKE